MTDSARGWVHTDRHMTICSAQSWYCARTKPKHEHIAASSVAKHLGLEVFLPRLRLERATRRGTVRVVEPLFPCYIFVRSPETACPDEIRYLTGISSLVQFGQKIATVPDDVVEDLRRCFDDQEPFSVQDHFVPGAEVTVAEGAFLGSQGVVVRVLPARERVQILLDFLGRTTVAEVDRKSLSLENRCLADLLPALANPDRMGMLAVV
jgi:transcriptional antiterminator RfaH